jgi:hypothetical protein
MLPAYAGPDAVAVHLRTAHGQLTRSSRWHRTQTRWATASFSLASLSPEDFRTRFTDPNHLEHTPTCVELLRLHQAGDVDATTLLLTAIAPIVGSLAKRDHRPHRFDHLWAAVARLLATAEPDSYINTGRPFLVTFMGRLRRDLQRSRATEDRGMITTAATISTDAYGARITPAFGPRLVSSIDDIVIARSELAAVADYVRTSNSCDRWNELVAHAVHAQPAPTAARVRIHRLLRQLVDVLDVA